MEGKPGWEEQNLSDTLRNGKVKIVIDQATKYYDTKTGKLHALEKFSATIRQSELVCILGPSGCGKTTLLWAMSGLHPLTSGAVLLDNKPVTAPRPEIGMVFQDANLLPWRNLIQNILFPFEIKRLNPQSYRDHIRHLLETVGLAGFENKYPRELSGGMQQRASIVRCLSFDPEVLLMDEPFGALDAFTRDEMNLLLLRLWSEQRKTIAFVTHSITEALFLADRVLIMTARPGRLAKEFVVELPRPRELEMQTTPYFISAVKGIKAIIHGGTEVE
jgi:NitT/TauT family transport system ATP-binding protein